MRPVPNAQHVPSCARARETCGLRRHHVEVVKRVGTCQI